MPFKEADQHETQLSEKGFSRFSCARLFPCAQPRLPLFNAHGAIHTCNHIIPFLSMEAILSILFGRFLYGRNTSRRPVNLSRQRSSPCPRLFQHSRLRLLCFSAPLRIGTLVFISRTTFSLKFVVYYFFLVRFIIEGHSED